MPVAKFLEMVRTNPAMPIHWGKNQAGMQAREETEDFILDPVTGASLPADLFWFAAAQSAAAYSEAMAAAGYHKQIANRLTEPFQWMSTIVSSTTFANFFSLRDHEDAQPEFRHEAKLMREALNASWPVLRPGARQDIEAGWHLPFVTQKEREQDQDQPMRLASLSAARCARASYMNHEGTVPDQGKDMETFFKLKDSAPMHASPLEHQAFAHAGSYPCRNFHGWYQHRATIESRTNAE